jgi:hypothetical protein
LNPINYSDIINKPNISSVIGGYLMTNPINYSDIVDKPNLSDEVNKII